MQGTKVLVVAGVLSLVCSLVGLWTLAKYLQRSRRLWSPTWSISFLFLVSSLIGAIVSVSLGYDQDSCGASAGSCALLGRMPCRQLVAARSSGRGRKEQFKQMSGLYC